MRQILLVIAVAVLLPTVCLAEQYLAYPFDANYDVPVKYFDPYPGFPTYSGHEGTDFACPYYTALYAPIAGQVTIHDGEADGSSAPGCTEAAGFGNYIIISSGTRRVRLAHCANGGFTVANGSSVTQGQLVAHSSNSGYTCGNDVNGSFYHLHLQLDLWEDGQWVAKNPYVLDGGVWITPRVYGGSITPTYSVTWQEQFPAYDPGMDALYLQPNETVACGLKVFNGSNVALSNDGNSEWYVELHSVSSAYNQDLASPLADAGWLTTTHIVSSNTICTPQASTWYYFNIHTPSTPGTYWLYMRLYRPHDGYGFLGQTGWNMKVVVTDPTPPPDPMPSPDAIIIVRHDASTYQWRTCVSNASSAFGSWQEVTPDFGNDGFQFYTGDVNGDGYDDGIEIVPVDATTMRVQVSLSDGAGHFTYDGVWAADFGNYNSVYLVGDFTGDGTCDIAHATPVDGSPNTVPIRVAYSTDSSFIYAGVWCQDFGNTGFRWFAGDFTGDGKCDIAYNYDADATTVPWRVAASTGTAFTNSSIWKSDFGNANQTHLVGDFNGDGKCDAAHSHTFSATQIGWYVALSYGSGFGGSGQWSADFGDIGTTWFVGDMDNDGDADIILAHPLTDSQVIWRVARSNRAEFVGSEIWKMDFGNDDDRFLLANVAATSYYVPKIGTEPDELLTVVPTTLAQNYPNPFNPVTTISYSLPEATHVTLKIYNILGQRVATLVNHEQEAGDHTVNWNAGMYSSGIYFYRLQAGEATETKKMVLLK